MLTAAEALKQSKSGIIEVVEPTIESEGLYRFNNESKVWETKIGSSEWYVSRKWNNWFTHPIFTPYDPIDTIDTELDEAKKRFPVGSWFNHKDYRSTLFKVQAVRRIWGTINIVPDSNHQFYATSCTPAALPHYPQGRCCLTDPPKKDGYYLVQGKGWDYPSVHRYDRFWFNLETREATNIIEYLWYPLPQRSE